MAKETNRGRDLPRGPEFKRKGWPREGTTGDPREDARRKQRAKNALAKLLKAHGYGQLDFGGGVTVGNDAKTIEKERKVVLNALTFELSVPDALAKRVGLEPDPGPHPTPEEDFSKPPF